METMNSGVAEACAQKSRVCKIPKSVDSTTLQEFTAVILSCFVPRSNQNLSYFDYSTSQVCGAWVQILPRLVDRECSGDLISSATKTFGTAILDRSPEGRHLNFQSFQAYNSTLQQLKNAIVAQKNVFHVETAAAIVCLAMAELMLPTSGNGFYAHLEGFGALINSYPPEVFSSDIFHAVFVGCRPILLFQALHARKSTFLAQEKWKTAPFRHHPPSDKQILLSDVAILPSILEEADLLQNSPQDTVVSRAQKLKARLSQIFGHLSKWNDRFRRDTLGPLLYPRQQRGSGYLQDTESCLWYPTLLTANAHTHIWSFQIICLTEIDNLDLVLSRYGCNTGFDLGQTRKDLHAATFELAVKVCQSIEYLLQDEMKLYGPASAIFPLKTAYNTLVEDQQGNQEHIMRCRRLIAYIRRKGFSTELHFPAEYTDVDNCSHVSV